MGSWEEIKEFQDRVKKLDQRRFKMRDRFAKQDYINKVNNGDWSVYCMEYEKDMVDFIDDDMVEDGMEKIANRNGVNKMNDRIMIRVSKGSNFIELERKGIKNQDDMEVAKEYFLSQARNILNSLPNEVSTIEEVTPKEYHKSHYKPNNGGSTVHKKNDLYTIEDIKEMTKYAKGGQLKVARRKLNNKEITVDDIKSWGRLEDGSYDDKKGWNDMGMCLFPDTHDMI